MKNPATSKNCSADLQSAIARVETPQVSNLQNLANADAPDFLTNRSSTLTPPIMPTTETTVLAAIRERLRNLTASEESDPTEIKTFFMLLIEERAMALAE